MTYFGDVKEFHCMFHKPPEVIVFPLSAEAWARRVRLITEELAETFEAYALGDVEKFADGLADLAWVVIGTAVEAGIPFDAVWAEVRKANMAKRGGRLDASGKLHKPEGWVPPDIKRALGRR